MVSSFHDELLNKLVCNTQHVYKCYFRYRADNVVFKGLAQEICEVFPSESLRTYYLSPVKKSNSLHKKSKSSGGKIAIKWRNFHQKLKDDEKFVAEDGNNEIAANRKAMFNFHSGGSFNFGRIIRKVHTLCIVSRLGFCMEN